MLNTSSFSNFSNLRFPRYRWKRLLIALFVVLVLTAIIIIFKGLYPYLLFTLQGLRKANGTIKSFPMNGHVGRFPQS
jgi:hypothetical protein